MKSNTPWWTLNCWLCASALGGCVPRSPIGANGPGDASSDMAPQNDARDGGEGADGAANADMVLDERSLHSCQQNSDCASGQVCEFPTVEGCSGNGVCMSTPPHCGTADRVACGCDGTIVRIPCGWPLDAPPARVDTSGQACSNDGGSDATETGSGDAMPDGGEQVGSDGGTQAAGCGVGQWCWVSPLPTGDDFADAWSPSGNAAWAVTKNAEIFVYDGFHWNLVDQPRSPTTAWAIQGTGTNIVWVSEQDASGQGFVRHFDGASWSTIPVAPTVAPMPNDTLLRAMWASGPSDLWGVGANRLTHWDGQRWTDSAIPGGAAVLMYLWGSGPRDIYVLGSASPSENAVVLHYDGAAWSTVAGWNVGSLRVVLLQSGSALDSGGISGTSANDVTIAYPYYPPSSGNRSALSHFDGHAWTQSINDQLCTGGLSFAVPQTGHRLDSYGGFGMATLITREGCLLQHIPGARPPGSLPWVAQPNLSGLTSVSAGAAHFAVGQAGATGFWASGGYTPISVPSMRTGIQFLHVMNDHEAWAATGPDSPLFAAGGTLALLHIVGQAISSVPISFGNTSTIRSLVPLSSSEVWVLGFDRGSQPPTSNAWKLAHLQGTTTDIQPTTYNALWGDASDNLWAAGCGVIAHLAQAGWQSVGAVPANVCIADDGYSDTTSLSGSNGNVWAVGYLNDAAPDGFTGTSGGLYVAQWDGTTLINHSAAIAAAVPALQSGVVNNRGVYAMGNEAWVTVAWDAANQLDPQATYSPRETLLHWNGSTWQHVELPIGVSSARLPQAIAGTPYGAGVWGSATSDVWFLLQSTPNDPGTGNALAMPFTSNAASVLLHWNGMNLATTSPGVPLIGNALSGSSAHDLWLAGANGAMVRWGAR